jgi:hypothetical protein
MIKHAVYLYAILLFMLISCKTAIKPDDLYGTWKYTEVVHPKQVDTLNSASLKAQSPSIQFFKTNKYQINWGGKVLSHGTFTLSGMSINIKETLPDGTTRSFPFWVSALNDKQIVFSSQGDDEAKVTATRQ